MNEEQKKQIANYNEEISKQLKKLSSPLLGHFNEFSVGYTRRYHNGSRMLIETNRNWLNLYLSLNFYDEVLNQNLDSSKNLNGREHVHLVSGEPTTPIHSIFFDFDMWNSVSLHFFMGEYTEAFHFGTSKDNLGLINLFANEKDLFLHLILYIRNRLSSLKINEAPLIVNYQKENDFGNNDEVVNDKVYVPPKILFSPQINKDIFFNNTRIKRFYLQDSNIYLTQREVDCMVYLCKGYTVKHVAKFLKISPRTAEGYINAIKIKLGLRYKNELLAFFQKNSHVFFNESSVTTP